MRTFHLGVVASKTARHLTFTMEIFLKIIHVFASVFLVLVVLLQSGRGGGMGAAFGGASSQIFGGRGASSFLSRVTSGAAIVFFCTSLTLSMMSSRHRSVLLKSGALPSRTAPSHTAPESGEAASSPHNVNVNGNEDKPDDLVEAHDGSLKGDTSRPAAEAVAPKRPDGPEPTPPGVPTGH